VCVRMSRAETASVQASRPLARTELELAPAPPSSPRNPTATAHPTPTLEGREPGWCIPQFSSFLVHHLTSPLVVCMMGLCRILLCMCLRLLLGRS
jgi:hypothetical protein